MLSGLDQGCCDQAEARFASHHYPGFWLVIAGPSCPLIGWHGPLTSLAAWMWSDLWIWSALSRLIRAYLSTPCPHCYHTLSLSPVSAASLIGAQETEALSLAFCHNSHYKLNRCPKFIEKIKVYRYVLRLDLPSYITTAWTQTFLSVIVILLLVTVSQEWL